VPDWPETLDRGSAGAPREGEERSGDVAVFCATAAGGLVGVIDGLGHGPDAADAAEACASVVCDNPQAPPQELLELCHAALLDSRGAVMTVAWFDLERGALSWTGVGNVDARLVRAGPDPREEVALVFGGVLGYRLPKIRPATMELSRGDMLVMITDGIESAISPALEGGGGAQALADRIFAMHGRGTDDALAAVVRYR
jgi:negative regulator of sigma-B (phosphoserine phosphatase)